VLSQIAEKKSEAEREVRKRERLEKDVRDLKAAVDTRSTEVRADPKGQDAYMYSACTYVAHIAHRRHRPE
jgi:hypothetical protein